MVLFHFFRILHAIRIVVKVLCHQMVQNRTSFQTNIYSNLNILPTQRVSSEPRRFGPEPGRPRLKAEKLSPYVKTKARAGKQGSRSLKPERIGYEPGRLSPKQGKLSLEKED
jgi:hypothetical protein